MLGCLGTDGSFGVGGMGNENDAGGGGYYGSGSSYIGGVSSGATSSGVNSGDGLVTIDW